MSTVAAASLTAEHHRQHLADVLARLAVAVDTQEKGVRHGFDYDGRRINRLTLSLDEARRLLEASTEALTQALTNGGPK